MHIFHGPVHRFAPTGTSTAALAKQSGRAPFQTHAVISRDGEAVAWTVAECSRKDLSKEGFNRRNRWLGRAIACGRAVKALFPQPKPRHEFLGQVRQAIATAGRAKPRGATDDPRQLRAALTRLASAAATQEHAPGGELRAALEETSKLLGLGWTV